MSTPKRLHIDDEKEATSPASSARMIDHLFGKTPRTRHREGQTVVSGHHQHTSSATALQSPISTKRTPTSITSTSTSTVTTPSTSISSSTSSTSSTSASSLISSSSASSTSTSSTSSSSSFSSSSSTSSTPPIPTPPRRLPPTVLTAIALLKETDGRDKLCKTIQYTGKLMKWLMQRYPLLILSIISRTRHDIWMKRVDNVTGTLSTGRKLIRLGKWTYSVPGLHKAYGDWLHNPHPSLLTRIILIDAILAVLCDLCDDLVWFSSYGFLSSYITYPASRAASVTWFATVCIDLPLSIMTWHDSHVKWKTMQQRYYMMKIAVEKMKVEQMKNIAVPSSSASSSSPSTVPITAFASPSTSTSTSSSLRVTSSSISTVTSTSTSSSDTSNHAAMLAEVESLRIALTEAGDAVFANALNVGKFLGDMGGSLPAALQWSSYPDGVLFSAALLSGVCGLYKLWLSLRHSQR